MKLTLLFIGFSFIVSACSNSTYEEKPELEDTAKPTPALPPTLPSDTIKQVINKVDTTETKPKKKSEKKQDHELTSERASDAKFNGEPILLQEVIKPQILDTNPDTLKELVKSYYQNEEKKFPRSVADNFKEGTSIERIHYPRLNYTIEVYKDQDASKPYKTLTYSARKENNKIIVE